MYAIYRNGQIVGQTRWPNSTSATPVDQESSEWLAYVAVRDRVPTEVEEMNDKVQSDPALRAIAQELESRFPGFIASARTRL